MDRKILVISHERSGTHFLINTIAQCFNYSPQQIDMDNTRNIDWKDPGMVRSWLAQFQGMQAPVIFKSHHSAAFFEPLFPDILDEFDIFYIARDGRDVMTSFWVYLNRLAPGWGPRTATVGEFMRTVSAGGIRQYQFHENSITMLQRWVEHVDDWKHMNAGVNYVTYEDLHSRFDDVLVQIAGVLGQAPARSTRPSLDAPSSLPWKGSMGTWKEYFTNEDVKYFDLHASSVNI